MADLGDAEYLTFLESRFEQRDRLTPELARILRTGLDAFDQLEQHALRSSDLTWRGFRSRSKALARIQEDRARFEAAIDVVNHLDVD